jgi:hypothetical protein
LVAARFATVGSNVSPLGELDAADQDTKLVNFLKSKVPDSRVYSPPTLPFWFMTYGCAKWSIETVLAFSLIGLGDHRLVKLNPDAAKLLGRRRLRTVKDVLDLPAWPYGRLRIAIERRPLIEVMIEPV